MNPLVISLLIGQVRELGIPDAPDPMDRPWSTGMFKVPVHGEVWLGETGLAGDQVSDTVHHGGRDKAVFAYPISHYVEYWNLLPGLETLNAGAMGENLAIEHATEDTICLGDVFQFHDAIIQVSQPRQPCWKPARRFRMKDLALRTQQTGRTGWYFRVLQPGYVIAGTAPTLLERPSPQWTITMCNHVMHSEPKDLQLTAALADHPYLATSWIKTLKSRLSGSISSSEIRLHGYDRQ